MSFSCEKFLNTIVYYRKHCRLWGHGPPGPAPDVNIILAARQQLHFCWLLRFIIISGVHGAFHFSLMCMCKTLQLKTFFLRKC